MAILGRGQQLHRDLAQALLLAQQRMIDIQDWEAEYMNALWAEEAKEMRRIRGEVEEDSASEDDDEEGDDEDSDSE